MDRKIPYIATLGACIAMAVVLWAATIAFLLLLERSTLEEGRTRRQNLARSLGEYQASSVRAIDLSLVFLRELWSRDPARFREAVRDFEQTLRKEKVIQVAIVDGDGNILYSHLPQPGAANFSDREYFRLHRSRRTDALYVSAPVFGRITQQWAIQMSRPILDARGAFAGLIVMAVPPPALEAVFRDIDLGREGVVTFVRDDGQVLARSAEFERTARFSIATWPAIAPQPAMSGEFVGRGQLDGVERYFSYRKIPDYGLAVLVGQSVEALMAPYVAQRNYALAVAAAATLLLLAVAAVVMLRLRDRVRFAARHENLLLELHDGCIQAIYAAGLRLQAVREVASRDPEEAARVLAEVEADLNLVIQDLRAVIAGGERPRYSAEEFVAQVQRSIPATHRAMFSIDIDEGVADALPPEKSEHVLRIVREAASNVARHAQARRARITLGRRQERVHLRVDDDGEGHPADDSARGMGLAHIHARAKKLGGTASFESAPGKGTRITVEFPA